VRKPDWFTKVSLGRDAKKGSTFNRKKWSLSTKKQGEKKKRKSGRANVQPRLSRQEGRTSPHKVKKSKDNEKRRDTLKKGRRAKKIYPFVPELLNLEEREKKGTGMGKEEGKGEGGAPSSA